MAVIKVGADMPVGGFGKMLAEQGYAAGPNIARDKQDLNVRFEELNKGLAVLANNCEQSLGRLVGSSYPRTPEVEAAKTLSSSFVDYLHAQIDDLQRSVKVINYCMETIEQKVR